MQLAVFGPVSHAFQKISLGFVSHVFHYWWDGLFVPAAIVRFAVVFRRICANRGWVDCLADNGMEYQNIRSLNRTNTLYNMVLPGLFGEMDLHLTKLAPFRGQR